MIDGDEFRAVVRKCRARRRFRSGTPDQLHLECQRVDRTNRSRLASAAIGGRAALLLFAAVRDVGREHADEGDTRNREKPTTHRKLIDRTTAPLERRIGGYIRWPCRVLPTVFATLSIHATRSF